MPLELQGALVLSKKVRLGHPGVLTLLQTISLGALLSSFKCVHALLLNWRGGLDVP